MFISVKKKTLLAFAAFVLFAASFTLAVTAVSKAGAEKKNGFTVVIDAGHGGADGGVIGAVTGAKESDINLAVARSLKHFLTGKGYAVVMTRSTTDGLYGMAAKGRKLKDMAARKKIILDAAPDLVVSIHQNAYPRPAESGAQVFYAPASQQGREYSIVMQNVLNASLGSKRVNKAGDYFVLQCSDYPSILVECGFLTNPAEEKLLVSAVYQEKVAYAIFTGIHSILGAESAAPRPS